MNVLILAPRVPLPADSGGTLRALQLARALDGAFRLTVLAVDHPGANNAGFRALIRGRLLTVREQGGAARTLWALGRAVLGHRPLGYHRYAGEQLRAAFERLLRRESFDLIHFDHLHTAQLLPVARKLAPHARLVVDEHNVEAQVIERLGNLETGVRRLGLRWQAGAIRRLESAILAEADLVLACSCVDAGTLQSAGARAVEVVPNGVAWRESAPKPGGERTDVAFVGSMDWWPNADAALQLGREIWPRVAGRLPGTRLALIGRNPSAAVRALASDRVVVTGTIPDVAPWLDRAWVTAIPLRAGSGTRLKILEAAAARVPVVATRLAAEGLPLEDEEHLLFAETPSAFAEALVRLRGDPSLSARLTAAAARVAQEFDWRRVGERLVRLYQPSDHVDTPTRTAVAGA